VGWHQPSTWIDVATVTDPSAEHELRLVADEDGDIVVSCACLADSHGCLKPLATLYIPNGRVTEVYQGHLNDVELFKNS
jgi:hypothetical protein